MPAILVADCSLCTVRDVRGNFLYKAFAALVYLFFISLFSLHGNDTRMFMDACFANLTHYDIMTNIWSGGEGVRCG